MDSGAGKGISNHGQSISDVAAAELTGRVCCGLELDPKYVDVVVQRWQTLSGKHALLAKNMQVTVVADRRSPK
jgi:hypothetical protein